MGKRARGEITRKYIKRPADIAGLLCLYDMPFKRIYRHAVGFGMSLCGLPLTMRRSLNVAHIARFLYAYVKQDLRNSLAFNTLNLFYWL